MNKSENRAYSLKILEVKLVLFLELYMYNGSLLYLHIQVYFHCYLDVFPKVAHVTQFERGMEGALLYPMRREPPTAQVCC